MQATLSQINFTKNVWDYKNNVFTSVKYKCRNSGINKVKIASETDTNALTSPLAPDTTFVFSVDISTLKELFFLIARMIQYLNPWRSGSKFYIYHDKSSPFFFPL